MENIKQINIKNRTNYFLNDMINIKDVDLNLLKIDKKNHTKALAFTTLNTLHKKVDDYESINSVNPYI